MKLRKLEAIINNVLWAIFILISLGIIWFAYTNRAPKFEPFSTEHNIPYDYTDKEGQKLKSEYQLAWYHPQYMVSILPLWPQKSEIIVYDPSNGNNRTIKEEYKSQYAAIMPASQIPAWKHWTTLMAVGLIIVAAIFVYCIGRRVRDYMIYSVVKKKDTFPAYAYYLYKDRLVNKKEARKNISRTIDSYINSCRTTFTQRYSKEFADLLINMLYRIKQIGNTKLIFYYTHVNDAIPHDQYLKNLSAYWAGQIGKNPQAEQYRNEIDLLRTRTYVDLYQGNGGATPSIVTKILKDLFSEVFDGEIINFEAYAGHHSMSNKQQNVLHVKTTAQNTPDSFTWSGSGYENKYFPGLSIQFKIYFYDNDKEVVLWNRYLKSKCTYQAEKLDVEDLYKNMISETISSFPESLKNK